MSTTPQLDRHAVRYGTLVTINNEGMAYTADQFLAVVNRYANVAEQFAKLATDYADAQLKIAKLEHEGEALWRRCYGTQPNDSPEFREFRDRLFDANMPDRFRDKPADSGFLDYVTQPDGNRCARVSSLGKLPAIMNPAKVAAMNVEIDPYSDDPHIVGEWPTEPGSYWVWSESLGKWSMWDFSRDNIEIFRQEFNKPATGYRRIGPLPIPPPPAR